MTAITTRYDDNGRRFTITRNGTPSIQVVVESLDPQATIGNGVIGNLADAGMRLAFVRKVQATDSGKRQILESLGRIQSGVVLPVGPEPVPSRLVVECMSDVEAEDIHWLWPGYVPLGKLSVLEGDPGFGKSLLTIQLAAAVSAGRSNTLPGWQARAPADVVFVTYEDGLADTVRPRLDAAGADCTRVHVVRGILDARDKQEGMFTLPDDTGELQRLVIQRRAALVVIDPLSAALSGGVDSYKDHDIRRALSPLAKLAEDTGATVEAVRHLTKGGGRRAILSGGGSMGIAGAARMVLRVGQAEDDPTRRVLAVVKCNIAAASPSLVYSIAETANRAPVVVWHGVSSLTADDLAAARDDEDGATGGLRDEIEGDLREWLRPSPMSRKDVMARARNAGYSDRSADRVAKIIGVQRTGGGFGADRITMWSLPGASELTPIPPSPPITATSKYMAVMDGFGGDGRNGVNAEAVPAAGFDTADDV